MMFTGKWYEDPVEELMNEPDEFSQFKNCQFISDPIDYSAIPDKIEDEVTGKYALVQ